jgi:hypothetical protein
LEEVEAWFLFGRIDDEDIEDGIEPEAANMMPPPLLLLLLVVLLLLLLL